VSSFTIFILQEVAACGDSLDILKEVHPEKLSRLHKRLVTPVQCGGPCPLPSFPGQQEFYHDFILHCSHHFFLQHLADSLASEILALNETSFMASDLEDKGRVSLDGKGVTDILSFFSEVVHSM
jgi:codanin-1